MIDGKQSILHVFIIVISDYIARCINRSTTRKQTTTRRGEKGIIYSSTIANKGDHGNIPAAAAGSVTGVLVIIVFVLVAVCIARKKKRPIAIAANQVQNAGREMLRSVSETGKNALHTSAEGMTTLFNNMPCHMAKSIHKAIT